MQTIYNIAICETGNIRRAFNFVDMAKWEKKASCKYDSDELI